MSVLLNTTDVKAFLNLSTSSTTYDTAIALYIPVILDDIVAYTRNKFFESNHWVDNTGFVVSSSNVTITLPSDSTSNWEKELQADDTIYLNGFWFNDGYYSVSSLTTSVITTNEALIDESSTDYAIRSIVHRCKFPDYVKAIGARMIWFKIGNSTNVQGGDITSESYGGYSRTYSGVGSAEGTGSFGGYPSNILSGLKRVAKLW